MSENGMEVGLLEEWVHAAYRLETWAHGQCGPSQPKERSGARHGKSEAVGVRDRSEAQRQSQQSAGPSHASARPNQAGARLVPTKLLQDQSRLLQDQHVQAKLM
ncbi:hypothetical protein Tco_0807246 [Tanacetum coccineum]